MYVRDSKHFEIQTCVNCGIGEEQQYTHEGINKAMNLQKCICSWSGGGRQNACITLITAATEKVRVIKTQSAWLLNLNKHISHEDKR